MTLVFVRILMQRYRSILHFIDPFIDNGYKLVVQVHGKSFNFPKMMRRPWNAVPSSKASMLHISEAIGIPVKHIDSVKFKTDKKYLGDLALTIDDRVRGNKFMSLPFVGFHSVSHKNTELVGNPMCELLRNVQARTSERPGSLLLVHPGGGRGYISPARKQFPPDKVRENNKEFIKSIVSSLPSRINNITIKIHPIPYVGCGKSDIQDIVKELSPRISMVVTDKNLISALASHEFVLNFGSSTSVWLLGSTKKWLNITGCDKFKYKHHREKKQRAKHWKKWPQLCQLDKLAFMIDNYESYVKNHSLPVMQKFKEMFNLPTTEMVLNRLKQM